MVTIYLLASTVTVPIYGKLSDMYGRKPLLLAGVGIFLTGSALAGLSQNIEQLIAFRGLQGLGAGGAANPHAILSALGGDADNASFWKQGLAEAGRYIDEIAKRLPAVANDDAKTAPPKRKQKGHAP